MATRTRKTWRPGKDGRYSRQIGWKASNSGKLVQPKFRLGDNLREAKRRDHMLAELWSYVERRAHQKPIIEKDGVIWIDTAPRVPECPTTWPDDLLEVAYSVARSGKAVLKSLPEEPPLSYYGRCSALQSELPFVRPEDAGAFRQGFDELVDQLRQASAATENAAQGYRDMLSQVPGGQSLAAGPTLHEAMRDHIAWLKDEYRDPDSEITDWGRTRIKQVETLIERHEDQPLEGINHDEVDRMIRYWRQRPTKKGTDKPITKMSAENFVTALKNFFKWLSRSAKHDWRKPLDFDEIPTRVNSRPEDVRPQITPDDIFTLDELILLNRYATPLERTLLLLGLNCGFARAEIASLLIGEVHLRSSHEPRHQEILGFESSAHDSFIKRYRRKSGVYGEFILFPQTVQAIEWVLGRRKKQPGYGPRGRLLLNARDEPYDKPTAGGNPNQQIPNRFAQLLRRIEDDGKQIKRRSFKTLRKTAGDLVRRFADGEVSAVFQCRGQPVKIDDLADVYTSRPFGKVFEAIRKVETHLQPMFNAAGTAPFGVRPKTRAQQALCDRILKLRHNGMSVPEIAKALKKHPSTVYRHLKRPEGG